MKEGETRVRCDSEGVMKAILDRFVADMGDRIIPEHTANHSVEAAV